MNSNLNVGDESLHRSLFCTSDLKQSQMLEQFAVKFKELLIGKHSKNPMKSRVMKKI